MWDFARKNWKTNIAFQGGRTTSRVAGGILVVRPRPIVLHPHKSHARQAPFNPWGIFGRAEANRLTTSNEHRQPRRVERGTLDHHARILTGRRGSGAGVARGRHLSPHGSGILGIDGVGGAVSWLAVGAHDAGHFVSDPVGDFGCQDGKHLPKATSSLGDPLIRIFRRRSAHTTFFSFRRKPIQVCELAVTCRSRWPT
jgi:hypothetical protein